MKIKINGKQTSDLPDKTKSKFIRRFPDGCEFGEFWEALDIYEKFLFAYNLNTQKTLEIKIDTERVLEDMCLEFLQKQEDR